MDMIINSEEAAKWAGNYSKLAKILGISRQAVRNWGEHVPQSSAWKLHILSEYKLGYQREDSSNQN